MPAAAVRTPKLFVDTHVRVVAWMHIALALLTLALVSGGAFVLAVLHQLGQSSSSSHLFTGLGAVVLVGLGIFPCFEILGAAKLLAGTPSGRIITMVFSVVHLLNFPVGSAVCVYSFWVLLRDPPKTARLPVPAKARATATDAVPLPSSTNADLAAAISARRSALAVARSRVAAEAAAGAATSVPPRTVAGARPAMPGRPATSASTPSTASTPTRPRTPRPS